MRARVLLALLALCWSLPASAPAQDRDDARLAARCWKLSGIANRYVLGRGEGTYFTSFVVTSAQLDCQKGQYARGVAALEKYLRDQGFTLPPE